MASSTALGTTGRAAGSSSTDDEQKLHAEAWLLCRAGSRAFALPIPDVVETLRALPIEQLAGAPSLVRGLCIIRGAAVVVLDTGVLFGDQALNYQRIVTMRVGRRTIGFLAEAVIGIRTIPVDALAQLPPLLSEIETIGAITRLDDRLVFLLQAARAVPEDFLASIDRRELQI
jgi:purine-binding chemotaxis protein CheW